MIGALPRAIEEEVRPSLEAVLYGAPAHLAEFDGEYAAWVGRWEPGRFAELAVAGGRAAEVTLLQGAAPGAKLVVESGGARTGSLGAPELDDEAARIASELIWQEKSERRGTMFIDVLVPPPRLLVFGAGESAACLRRVGRAAGWRVFVIDPFVSDEEDVVAAWPEEAVARLGDLDPATSVVVVSHHPEFGPAALALALRSPARFVGAMGSRRTQEARRSRLGALGFDERAWARISAPVGLDLGASEPGETAVSIMAEVVAARHGRPGGRISVGDGRIHPGALV